MNVWQYSRWTWIIARTMRLNYPTSGERSAVETFITSILSNRPWLKSKLYNDSTTGRNIDIPNESNYNLSKMLGVVGRDLKKTPMTISEKNLVDNLISATGNRRYGEKGNLI